VLVVVRLHDGDLPAAAGPLPAVDVRPQGVLLALQLVELRDQGLPFGAARRIGQVRLIDGSWRSGRRVHTRERRTAHLES
jgi:hypothetical protein